ncbi:DUF559 domain-containing protein [Pectobacterium brasiliense]|uniref:DUF559 domain-containing protein n=1 Tax=Pectobacterium brasiliense TaxID=180957 RepID=UPI001968DD9A|nr:DUF559 domain-containing protein [Pectobacterium brasiliense]
MQENKNKTIWCRVGIIAVLLLVSFFFPFMLLIIGWLIWTICEDLKTPSIIPAPPIPTWRDAKADDKDWLSKFCLGCESPAEESFLRVMVGAFNLKPDCGKLISPELTLEIQVSAGNYRFDFLANGRQVIEIDGAAWHSSPEQIERDRIRDEYSVEQGYRVLRIPAKVVFNTPDKAIKQVKAAIAATPHYTLPAKPQFAAPIKSLAQHLSTFSDRVIELDRYVESARVKQLALADFKSAISLEKMLLEALVSEVEREMRIEAMLPPARSNYERIKAKFEVQMQNDGTVKPSREEIYRWKEIAQPSRINDVEIQEQIEKEYQSYMDQRSLRLAQLRQRCVDDQIFAQFFRHKIEEVNYPEAEMVLNTATKS